MDVLLTDQLICPRCGPDFGLILWAGRVEDRRVIEGAFGCSNCREQYLVSRGVGDFRGPVHGDEGSPDVEAPESVDVEEIEKLAALLGLAQGSGYVVLGAGMEAYAAGLCRLVPSFEIVQMTVGRWTAPPTSGVSPIMGGDGFPVRSGALRAVGLRGPAATDDIEEAARVLTHGGRLVVFSPGAEAATTCRELGLNLLLETEEAVVAERPPWPGRGRSSGVQLPVVSGG